MSSLNVGVYSKVGLLFEREVPLSEVVCDGIWSMLSGEVAEVVVDHDWVSGKSFTIFLDTSFHDEGHLPSEARP